MNAFYTRVSCSIQRVLIEPDLRRFSGGGRSDLATEDEKADHEHWITKHYWYEVGIEFLPARRTLVITASSDQGAMATKCSNDWCFAAVWAGAVRAAIGSTLLRSPGSSSPVQ
jgi:hypothetical protein